MKKRVFKKLDISIPEFINSKSEELKDIPTYYYNKNNIFAVLEYLEIQNKYHIRNDEIYEIQYAYEIEEYISIKDNIIEIINEK